MTACSLLSPRWAHRRKWPPTSLIDSEAASIGWASTPRTSSARRHSGNWPPRWQRSRSICPESLEPRGPRVTHHAGHPLFAGRDSTGEKIEDLPDRPLAGGGLGDREVRLDLVAIPPAVLGLDEV